MHTVLDTRQIRSQAQTRNAALCMRNAKLRKLTVVLSPGIAVARPSRARDTENPWRPPLGNPANLPTALRHRITYLHVAKFESIATADIAL